ncbi:hypothetical protein GeomeDRAFT_1180 [Geobacter metallireducens RCH3]|nr:hypothetical protein GeomeDRAFT_1180 [Geobacter metallireducens RCH3]
MEPIVVFGVGLVAWGAYICIMDMIRDRAPARSAKRETARAKAVVRGPRRPAAAPGRGGAAAARWPMPAEGSA